MKNKFIRVISPAQICVMLMLDASAAVMLAYSIKRITEGGFYNIAFLVIASAVIVIAVLTSIELMKNGVFFRENEFEFTGLDDNNIYRYSEIKRTETHKDTSASLSKNTVERYSSIILYMDDETVATVELGYTTKKTLKKIEEEINKRTV